MTINQLIKEKGMSRYSFSKASNIPWATLFDICSGKTAISRCNGLTLQKLAKGLGISIEEAMNLEVEPTNNSKKVKPTI